MKYLRYLQGAWKGKRSPALLAAFAALLSLSMMGAVPAKAEGRCPPGYFPTGGGSAGWEGCAPMWPMDDGGGSAGKEYSGPSAVLPPRPHRRGFVAVAYHVDTGSIWASVAHKTFDGAKQRALAGCNAATGGGCYIAAAVGGGAEKTFSGIFLAQDGMGQFWVKDATGQDLLLDPDVAMRECLIKSFGCDSLNGYEPGDIYLDVEPDLDQSKDYFPKGQLNHNRWAMVARPEKPTTVAHGKSWLISGKENSAATRKEILDRCQADAGVPCAISAYAIYGKKLTETDWIDANGLLVHYVDGRGKNHWTTALSARVKKKKKKSPFGGPLPTYRDPVTVQERIDRICPPSFCRVIATYDAATPRMQVIEDVK